MNNRRSFFAQLALGSAAIFTGPQIFLPKEPVKWKRTPGLWIRNPEWVSAPYEILIVDAHPIYDPSILQDALIKGGAVADDESSYLVGRSQTWYPPGTVPVLGSPGDRYELRFRSENGRTVAKFEKVYEWVKKDPV